MRSSPQPRSAGEGGNGYSTHLYPNTSTFPAAEAALWEGAESYYLQSSLKFTDVSL